jgi:hypothetical protein
MSSLIGKRSDEHFAVYLILILPVTISRMDENITISLDTLLGFTCMLLFMVRSRSPHVSEYT